MKLLKIQSIALSTLVLATPAFAQTNDQAVNEGAGVIAWILVGLIGGYLASRIVNKTGEGVCNAIKLSHFTAVKMSHSGLVPSSLFSEILTV